MAVNNLHFSKDVFNIIVNTGYKCRHDKSTDKWLLSVLVKLPVSQWQWKKASYIKKKFHQ